MKDVLENYKRLREIHPDIWLIDCKRQVNFDLCIEMAALARNSSHKKHPHQYRIPNKILQNFATRLKANKNRIISCGNFDALYDVLDELRYKGIGPLTLYDTAHRIGKKLNVHPEKVYLHRGAKIGAEKILGRKIKTRTIDKSEFLSLSEFTCEEIEDILCLSKGNLNTSSCFNFKSKNNCR